MATPYLQVYNRFLQKINDYEFLSLTDEELSDELEGYLISSIPKYKKCKADLGDRDDFSKQFNNTLTDEEIEILSVLMIVEYLSPKIITSELLKQGLSTKDFKIWSQANHIKELITLRNEMKNEANQLLMSYSYYNGNLEDLK